MRDRGRPLPQCRGGWLDEDELTQLEATVESTDEQRTGMIEYANPTRSWRARSAGTMTAFNYRAYNLELDVCDQRHGFWLDEGEAFASVRSSRSASRASSAPSRRRRSGELPRRPRDGPSFWTASPARLRKRRRPAIAAGLRCARSRSRPAAVPVPGGVASRRHRPRARHRARRRPSRAPRRSSSGSGRRTRRQDALEERLELVVLDRLLLDEQAASRSSTSRCEVSASLARSKARSMISRTSASILAATSSE